MSSPSTTRAAPSSQARDLSVALLSLYTELARLPYVPSESLVVPPPDGWPHINVSELRTRGKTGEVISLPQHLPFLSTRADGARWMVAPDAQAIDYSNGEVYSEILDEIQPTPAWCIWLTDPENRDGTGVLFDTKTGMFYKSCNIRPGLSLLFRFFTFPFRTWGVRYRTSLLIQ